MPPINRPVSCCGNKPFGMVDVQNDVQPDGDEQDQHDQRGMPQRPGQGPAVERRARDRTRFAFLAAADRRACRNRAHIIGVVVNEIASDTRIAIDSVTANSRNRRPTMPPISRIGRNTAISDRLMETTVKPTSLRALQGGLKARHAFLDMAGDVFQHDDRVVDDEAGGDGQRHQRQIVQAVAQQIHRAEGADDRHRHGDRRDQGRADAAQEQEHHQR